MNNRRKYIVTQQEVCIWDLLLQDDIQETENKQRLMSDRSAVDSWIPESGIAGEPEYVTLAAVQEGYSDPSWSP